MKDYIIYTDGSCRANKVGGVGIIYIENDKKVFEFSKRYENVTNNKTELLSIFIALKSLIKPINSLTIVSDSEYSIGVLTNPSWNPKKNVKLISEIKKQIIETQKLVKNPIKWLHTRGHQKDVSEHTKWNNRADKLAQEASL